MDVTMSFGISSKIALLKNDKFLEEVHFESSISEDVGNVWYIFKSRDTQNKHSKFLHLRFLNISFFNQSLING